MAVYSKQEIRVPPIQNRGLSLWLKDNLFSSYTNSLLTIMIVFLLFEIIPPLFNWLIFEATFSASNANECSANQGACWAYIGHKFNLFIYGFYPPESYWRIHLVFLLIPFIWVIIRFFTKEIKSKRLAILASLIIYPFVAFYLLHGGWLLTVVETDRWGGLLLTLIIAVVGIVASMPIGILLALGRRSSMPTIRYLSIIYIEFIRGVPLISILFMASVVLPLFLEVGTEIDKLLRALIGITLFQAAYIAEIVRGGLQAIPQGQYEAADSLGLNFWKKISLVIMPQVLKISIPNLTGSCIGLFKDSTLVLIIGLFDMLAMVQLTTSDSNWLGLEIEGYVFVTLMFWLILYNMSRYAKNLENRLKTDH